MQASSSSRPASPASTDASSGASAANLGSKCQPIPSTSTTATRRTSPTHSVTPSASTAPETESSAAAEGSTSQIDPGITSVWQAHTGWVAKPSALDPAVIERIGELLRAHGLRRMASRIAVLAVLEPANTHLSVAEIDQRLRECLPGRRPTTGLGDDLPHGDHARRPGCAACAGTRGRRHQLRPGRRPAPSRGVHTMRLDHRSAGSAAQLSLGACERGQFVHAVRTRRPDLARPVPAMPAGRTVRTGQVGRSRRPPAAPGESSTDREPSAG